MRVQRHLEQASFPRIQMTLIVALTGGVGLLASFLLLRAGVESMAVRYPVAVGLAYVFFLIMLWIWLKFRRDDLDIPDVTELPDWGSSDVDVPYSGGGGQFGGGGASGSFDGPTVASDSISTPSSSVTDGAGSIVDADELAIPIAVVALAAGLAVASLYVIYIAPVLFAELIVDGLLSVALYRRLRPDESSHWLATACRKSVLPFAVTAVFLAIVGAAMAAYAPGARSVGEVLQYDAKRK